MKVITNLLVILTLTIVSCKSEDKSPLSKQDFTFTVEFYPSFIESCKIVFQKKGDTTTLSLDNIIWGKNKHLNDSGKLKVEYFDNLLINERFHQYVGDTLFLKHLETVIINKADFKQFTNDLLTVDLSKQKSREDQGCIDGITVYYKFHTDSFENRFSSRCPHKSDSIDYKIIKALFGVFESSFKTKAAINYTEQLKGYFDFGLLVKHISDNPLEYRFYSHLSANEADEFYKFIKSLPKDKPIIIDFSNFGGMGTMFYSDFQNLITRNPHVYWLVNEYSKGQVVEIGVRPDRIFTNKQELIKKIKNTP